MTVKRMRYLLSLCICLVFFALTLRTPLFPMKGTVSGKVIDEETGKGIYQVSVNIFYNRNSQLCTTDKDGNFTFYEVEPGEIVLMFFPLKPYAMPLYREKANKFVLERDKNLYIVKKMGYGGTIMGKVFEKNTGQLLPVNDIYIEQHTIPLTKNNLNEGEYRIEQIKPGIHRLIVQLDGYGVRELANIEVIKNETVKIDIPFDSSSSTRVSGRVACTTNPEPIKNLGITLFDMHSELFSDTYTNSNGEYVFIDVLPGDYEVVLVGHKKNSPRERVRYKKMVKVIDQLNSVVNFEVDCNLDFSSFLKGEQ